MHYSISSVFQTWLSSLYPGRSEDMLYVCVLLLVCTSEYVAVCIDVCVCVCVCVCYLCVHICAVAVSCSSERSCHTDRTRTAQPGHASFWKRRWSLCRLAPPPQTHQKLSQLSLPVGTRGGGVRVRKGLMLSILLVVLMFRDP